MFAISQAALHYALPHGIEVLKEPNDMGALLEPIIYRDIKISCMYLVEDVEEMLVPIHDVPQFVETLIPDQSMMVTPKKKSFKGERKSDFSSGAYVSSIKKVRKVEVNYPIAQENVKKMICKARETEDGGEEGGEERDGGEEDGEEYKLIHPEETMYVLKCLVTSCTSTSMFDALDYYPSALINSILHVDLNYHGADVLRNKANLLLVCENFLNHFDLKAI